MSPKKENQDPERRRFQRLPVLDGLIEPVTLQLDGKQQAKNQPAILTNLSAGGMSLVVFVEPPHVKRLDMVLSLPGLNHVELEGKVVRMHEKGQTYNLGIAFTKISKKHQTQINSMAQDHADCETRISLSLPEVCVKSCRFNALCVKNHKSPFWPKK